MSWASSEGRLGKVVHSRGLNWFVQQPNNLSLPRRMYLQLSAGKGCRAKSVIKNESRLHTQSHEYLCSEHPLLKNNHLCCPLVVSLIIPYSICEQWASLPSAQISRNRHLFPALMSLGFDFTQRLSSNIFLFLQIFFWLMLKHCALKHLLNKALLCLSPD